MPGKGTDKIAKESRGLRLKMHRLVTDGLSEQKALIQVLPEDSNRARKLKTWREKGLWPIPISELQKMSNTVEHRIISEIATITDTALQSDVNAVAQRIPKESQPARTVPPIKPEAQRVNTVQHHITKKDFFEEARELLDNIETKGFEWVGKGKTKENKTAILAGRMPLDVVEEIKRLRGKVTDHMEKALRLYLKILKANED